MDIVPEMDKQEPEPRSFKKAIQEAEDSFNSDKIGLKAKNLSETLKNFISKDKPK